MKVNSILLLVIVLFSAFVLVTCQDDAKARANPLLRRVGGRPGAKTSTTTPPPPPEEGDLGEEDYDQGEGGEGVEGDAEEPLTTTSSTEPPKKVGPIIRPFRSNDDLLNALRRRQQNNKPGASKPVRPSNGDDSESSQPAAPAPAAKSSSKDSGSRRRFGGNSKSAGGDEEGDAVEGEEVAPKRPSRFNLRSGRR